ncbi:MAG: radical SAM-associated putative lipoprotein, partial [Lentimicrobiaceae bacterium]|nr:radical SAM-associated putative lipoprotein [Lentimicrobiaceae bacterium]
MKKPIIKFFDKIIFILLGFSGIFYGCPKYGMPEANYELKGTVTNKETSRPVKHIQITSQIPHYKSDTLYTNSNGQYNHQFREFYLIEPLHLKFEDIDGEENGGEFISYEIDVDFSDAEQVKKGKGSWDHGSFLKIQNIELEKKQ